MSRMKKEILAASLTDVCQKEPGKFCKTYLFPLEFVGFSGHFPGNPVLPAVVQIMMAQTTIEEYEQQSLELRTVSKAKFQVPLLPNQEIEICCKKNPSMGLQYDISLNLAGDQASRFRLFLEEKEQGVI